MDSSKTLDPVSRLVVGAVVEDAVDQLAIVSATFGPVAEQHVNTSRRRLEDISSADAEECLAEVAHTRGDLQKRGHSRAGGLAALQGSLGSG